jgi:hypothetical protein
MSHIKDQLEEIGEAAGNKFKKILKWASLLLVLGGLCFFWVCSWTYSDGTRAGQLIKVTKKGIVFKTYEGQLNLGGLSGDSSSDGLQGNIWDFSVIKNEVYQDLQNYEGRKVKLSYKERYKTMPWLGKTNYIVTGIEPVNE